MKKLVLANPCYGPLDPEINKMLRATIMYAASNGVQWIGDVSSIRMGWVAGRNASAKAALESGADGIFWMDDDVMLPSQETIARLVGYNLDFVSGVIFQKAPPYYPLVSIYDETKDKGKGMRFLKNIPERVLLPCQGVGFGCVYTSTDLLRKIAALPSFQKDGWFNQIPSGDSPLGGSNGFFSEDFSFCLRAIEAKTQLYVDTAIMCGHCDGPRFIYQQHYLDAQKASLEDTECQTSPPPASMSQPFSFAE